MSNNEFPSLFQQARNLANELVETAKRAQRRLPIIVPEEVGSQRLALCDSCEFLNREKFRCTKCGCFMKTKTQFAGAKCPENKWLAYNPENV
jgi:hypothetical protein